MPEMTSSERKAWKFRELLWSSFQDKFGNPSCAVYGYELVQQIRNEFWVPLRLQLRKDALGLDVV